MQTQQTEQETQEIPLITPSQQKQLVKDAYQDTVIRLISRHEYYAHILLQLKVSFTDKKDYTLSVSIRQGCVHLTIGNEFFLKATEDMRVFFLQHEMAHIILGHLAIERNPNPKDCEIMNIAMDTAIHEILINSKTLFKDEKFNPCTVEGLRKMVKNDDIKNNETTEYYFNFLKTLKEELREKLKDFNFDDHEFTEGEGEGDDPFDIDVGKALTVGLLEKAKNKMGAGTTPGEAELTIDKFKKSKKNWRAILRRYTTSMTDDITKTTRNKRNRRYGFLIPGKKKTFKPKVVVIVDTSGSMCGEPLERVFSELVKMEKQGYEIVLIEADAAVQKVREFNSRGEIKIKGGGGTDYQPALDAAAKLSPDIVIYLTDLDPAGGVLKPKYPIIWADTSNGRGSFKPSFGIIIRIEE